jgi:succinate dehydrogenase/fumarate reductase flavoprotein subunit
MAAIWVNAQGKRFVRDGPPDPKAQVPRVLEQSPPAYWQIFDAASRPQFFVSGSDWNDPRVVEREIFANPKLTPWVKQAGSIEDLAQAAGLPAETLAVTVQRWNEMIERGEDSEFGRFGRASPIRPLKIATPPFFAIQLFPLARKSLGGVAVDLSCRVLDRKGQPIPGLYAIGELAGVGGINGKAALEGTMLGPGILMGRTAAKDLVGKLGRQLKPVARTDESKPGQAPAPRTTEPDSLRAWQEVLRQLIAQPRPGFFHFERAHTLVLARNYDCAKCHRETSPLAVTEDQLDRRAMIPACAFCHGGVKE